MNHLAAATNNHQTEVIMNQMAPFGNHDQTMSSLDFMEIVNRYRSEAGQAPHEPRKFLAKLEDELDDLTGKKFRLNNNQTKTAYYELNFDQMILVGMREAKIVRRNVLTKLKELENQQPAIPQTLPEALRLAADLAEKVEQQQALIKQQKPAVEFVGRYVEANGTMTFREVAKVLGLKQHELRQLEVEHKIMYQLNGRWAPYQHQIDSGRFTVKTGSADNGHTFTQARYTAKGVEYLAKLALLEVA